MMDGIGTVRYLICAINQHTRPNIHSLQRVVMGQAKTGIIPCAIDIHDTHINAVPDASHKLSFKYSC